MRTETGLWYYRNRMYSDVIGRFLQRDPAGFVDGLNLYAYVTNNPMRWVDPLGLWTTGGTTLEYLRQSPNPESVNALHTVLYDYNYSIEQGTHLRLNDWSVDHGTRTIYIADDNSFFWERSNSNAAAQLHQALSDEFYPVTGMSESWGGMGRRIGGGLLDTAGGAIVFVGGKALFLTPEPTMLTKIGGAGALTVGINNMARGTTSIFNRGGGFDAIGLGYAAAGDFLFDDPTSFQYANLATNVGFSLVGGFGTTSFASIPVQSLPGAAKNAFTQGLGRFGFADDLGGIDFYVHPNGTVIPATAYRAISPGGVAEAYSGSLSARPGGTYFTFDDILGLNQQDTRSFLQLQQTPSQMARFDTLQLGDDFAVPFSRWGQGSSLEPIVSTFPEYGIGGATQMITNSVIRPNFVSPILQTSDFFSVGTSLLNTFNAFDYNTPSNPFDGAFQDYISTGLDPDGILGINPNQSGLFSPFDSSGSFLNGGQSAAFVDRSRLIHRNSRAVSGRSTFTGRGNVPRPASLTNQLFR